MNTKNDLVLFLKSKHLKSSFRKKQDILDFLHDIKWGEKFPWRQEQSIIIRDFLSGNRDIITIQGLFGCGKTTLLLGMLNIGFWKDMFEMSDIFFCAFNVCIKNEIKHKIKEWGCKDKINVRTFDSLIYELCHHYKYPHLKKPNYEGKRIFIYNQKDMSDFTKYHHIKYLFVDETQDLEKRCFDIFKKCFPNARMIFVGDIFQSIQKEPRESLLWLLSNNKNDEIHYYYMKETPRIPLPILDEMKKAIMQTYPEYKTQISEWKSTNTHSDHHIEWYNFNNYKILYEKMFHFLGSHPIEKCMILTFSSCITVRGALGDLARIRRLLKSRDIPVNTNYKSMDKKSLFLSTVNSSKGLERDYVFIISTFPLEKAFINFSNDLTVNLVTVGISRAKKKAIVYVPNMKENFSTAFSLYPKCPSPAVQFFPDQNECIVLKDYIYLEHSVTEILRQNIIKYDTRLIFQSFIKKIIPAKINTDTIIPSPNILSEEEKSFAGILFEILITSSWTSSFPSPPDLTEIEFKPLYSHCIHKIKILHKKYTKLYKSPTKPLSIQFFNIIFLYTELFMAVQHKIFFHFSMQQRDVFHKFWEQYYPHIYKFKPSFPLQIQTNIKMPLLTGIIDAFSSQSSIKQFFEIKASVKSDWKEDAFIQVFIYAIMMGQSWFQLHLINLFKNEYMQYIIYLDKKLIHLRHRLLYDILLWNLNSFLAKKSSEHKSNIEDNYYIHYSMEDNVISEFVVLGMLSPTKIYIYFHTYDEDEIKDLIPQKNMILCNAPHPSILYHSQINIPSYEYLFEQKHSLPSDNIVLNTALFMIMNIIMT